MVANQDIIGVRAPSGQKSEAVLFLLQPVVDQRVIVLDDYIN